MSLHQVCLRTPLAAVRHWAGATCLSCQRKLCCRPAPSFLEANLRPLTSVHEKISDSSNKHFSSLTHLSPSPLVRHVLSTSPSTSAPVQRRGFRVMPPVRMGRRSSKIATRKNAQDAKRAKQYGKLGKQIVSSVKKAGPNPATNPELASALVFARQIGAPKELIDRNVKKASEKGQADFQEIVYEVYGLGGVGIVVEALSDNNARAAALVRDVVKKGGGKMADSGSVLFNFKRCGVISVGTEETCGDTLLEQAMDAGADDVLEPQDETEGEPSVFRVITTPETYLSVRAKLEEALVPVNSDLSGLELLPVVFVEPDDEAFTQNELLMSKLLDLDDVDSVFSNQKP